MARKPRASSIRNPRPYDYHERPTLIGVLLYRQTENLRQLKRVFLEDVSEETDPHRRRRAKADIVRGLRLVRDALVLAERKLDAYEPLYYDVAHFGWRRLTAEIKASRDDAAAEQRARWVAARNRREEERRAMDIAQENTKLDRMTSSANIRNEGGPNGESSGTRASKRERLKRRG